MSDPNEPANNPAQQEEPPPTNEPPAETLEGGANDDTNEGGSTETQPEPLTADAVKMPEGFEVDEASMTKFLDVMNNAEMTPAERAQALVDLQAEVMNAASERGSQLWQQTQDQWRQEAEKEFGTELQPMLGNIKQLIDDYGDDEFREVMDTTGAGNHPSMIRFLNKLAKERSAEGAPAAGSPGTAGRTAAEILYPSQGKG